mgnify:FL=1
MRVFFYALVCQQITIISILLYNYLLNRFLRL